MKFGFIAHVRLHENTQSRCPSIRSSSVVDHTCWVLTPRLA